MQNQLLTASSMVARQPCIDDKPYLSLPFPPSSENFSVFRELRHIPHHYPKSESNYLRVNKNIRKNWKTHQFQPPMLPTLLALKGLSWCSSWHSHRWLSWTCYLHLLQKFLQDLEVQTLKHDQVPKKLAIVICALGKSLPKSSKKGALKKATGSNICSC